MWTTRPLYDFSADILVLKSVLISKVTLNCEQLWIIIFVLQKSIFHDFSRIQYTLTEVFRGFLQPLQTMLWYNLKQSHDRWYPVRYSNRDLPSKSENLPSLSNFSVYLFICFCFWFILRNCRYWRTTLIMGGIVNDEWDATWKEATVA
jgi:hypothetical protein